ncbi:MAG: hypothetical protein Unbinned1819contig1001_11 [Prokaryotic dsDNA virus sp.]|nr:MAG: hypothetical protein Unbinned1819contig1001_11 [Prokaryotic dsDNA virus sp.]|tara:strand:- start:18668 stop:19027 length:360 start_codon:yes stop_codon:yes gene_type:complete
MPTRRNIKITDIAGLMAEEIEFIVKTVTTEIIQEVKDATPVDKGGLRNAWEMKIEKYTGEVTNNIEYAEPVLYGKNLPESWGGQYRTRVNTIPGFPDLILKEKRTKRIPQLIRHFRRRN